MIFTKWLVAVLTIFAVGYVLDRVVSLVERHLERKKRGK